MYKITKTNRLKGEELIDIQPTLYEANYELDEIRSMEFCRINYKTDTIEEIKANEKGLYFDITIKGEKYTYQVEYFDEIVEAMFDIFKPYNQN
jgi:hypothetical protein